MAGLLNTPPFSGGLLGNPMQGGLLGGRPTFASMYPEVVAGQTLPAYRPSEEQRAAMLREVLPDLAPVQIIKSMVSGIGGLAMQANAAMPWAGGDPTAVGLYPDGMAPEHYPRSTAGGLDPSVMVPFATDTAGLATTGSLAAPAVRNATGMGIRAYHGSPHDFDRFSMDKIGAGEGAQAYGHGLYFAENPGVAGEYRKQLTRRDGGAKMVTSYDVGGKHIAQSSPDWPAADVAGIMRQHGIDPSTPDGMDWLDSELGARRMSGVINDTDEARAKVLDFYKADDFKSETVPGRMYEVDIDASPDEFLDWDKPLSEQPPKVREALRPQYEVQPSGDGFDVVARTVAGDRPVVRYRSREAAEDYIKYAQTGDFPASEVQAMVRGGDERGTAEALRNAGIKGIRYRDAGSRAISPAADQMVSEFGSVDKALEVARQRLANARSPRDAIKAEEMVSALTRTHNYVVFDDKNINILKKYGIAGLTAGGAGAAALGGSTQDASAMPMPSYTTGGRF